MNCSRMGFCGSGSRHPALWPTVLQKQGGHDVFRVEMEKWTIQWEWALVVLYMCVFVKNRSPLPLPSLYKLNHSHICTFRVTSIIVSTFNIWYDSAHVPPPPPLPHVWHEIEDQFFAANITVRVFDKLSDNILRSHHRTVTALMTTASCILISNEWNRSPRPPILQCYHTSRRNGIGKFRLISRKSGLPLLATAFHGI